MDSSGILGMVGFGLSVIGIIVAAVNHTKIRSNCFGKKLEVSLDIDKTSPSVREEIKINIPTREKHIPIHPRSDEENFKPEIN